jgi:predicted Zn finger-like uncharacterized protein
MEVRCEKCQARYRVDDARIGPQGLTMRCGKCQNTFKVMRAAPPSAEPPAVPPKAAPPLPARSSAQTTMMFAAPVAGVPAPAPVARPATPPAPSAQPTAPKPAQPPSPADEAAGRTMMFQTGNLKPTSTAAKKPAQSPASSTIVFSQPPAARPVPAKPAARPAARTASAPAGPGDAARSTLKFGGPQVVQGLPPAVPVPPTVAPIPTPVTQPQAPANDDSGVGTMAERAADSPAPVLAAGHPGTVPDATPEAAVAQGGGEPADAVETGEDEESAPEPGTFDKAPPRGLLIGVAAGLVLLLVIGGGLVAYRKLGKRPPPPAAVEALTSAQADADKDTLASIASAETKARDALEVAGPRARFPEATATFARIEIQWADALNDEAAHLADQSADETRSSRLQSQAKAKLKSAFELLSPALKANKDSPDLQLAFADYYRALRLPSSMNRYLANVKDDPRAALIQGMAAAQEDEGAQKAIPRLKAALAVSPQSARVHYRIALAYLAARDDAGARAELKETLRLSPQHERAKALMEQLGAGSAAEQK